MTIEAVPLWLIAISLAWISWQLGSGSLIGPPGQKGDRGDKGETGERGAAGKDPAPRAAHPTAAGAHSQSKLARLMNRREDGTWEEGDWIAHDSKAWRDAFDAPGVALLVGEEMELGRQD